MDLAASDSLAPILGELGLNIVLRNLIARLPVTQEITQHDDRMVLVDNRPRVKLQTQKRKALPTVL